MKVCRNEESSNSGFVGFKNKQAKWRRSITRRQPESSEHQEKGIKGSKRRVESGCERTNSKQLFQNLT